MKRSGSQFDQDEFVLSKIHQPGYFVEAGAADGVMYSNTVRLAECGWTGVLIEPHVGLFEELCRNRPESKCFSCVLDSVEKEVDFWVRGGYISGTVAPETDQALPRNSQRLRKARQKQQVKRLPTQPLDAVLDVVGAPRVIDYLSLDTEGSEYRILKNFPFARYTFKLAGIERPKLELRALLASNGYRVIREDPNYDVFFAHASFGEES
jgi:FkbM family methyltransferase